MHRKIVALDTWHVPVPSDLFSPDDFSLTALEKPVSSRQQICDAVKDAHVIAVTLTQLDAHVLSPEITPSLQLIAAIAAGTDNIDLAACKARGIRVVNSPGCNTQSVAEHALALFFAARRNIPTLQHHMFRSQEWKQSGSLTGKMNLPSGGRPSSLKGEVVAIVGFGAIGQTISRLCRGLGMKVLVAPRKSAGSSLPAASTSTSTSTSTSASTSASNSDKDKDDASATFARGSFNKVMQQATVIFVCVPRNADTIGLISAAELSIMSQQALVINVSRGGVVDETALLAALRDGKIAGSAADVFLKEPSDAGAHWKDGEDTPLLQVSAEEAHALNLVVTPHVAWYTEDTFQSYISVFKKNVESWAAGEEQNVVV